MQNITKHYREIRFRLIYSFYAFFLAFLTCYYYQLELLYVLTRPFLELNHTLISTSVTEALSSILTLCFGISLLSFIPYLVYQWWCFRNPSKYSWETHSFSLIFLFSFFFCELVFIYTVLFPRISQFFSSFQITVLAETDTLTKTLIEISPRLDSIIHYSTQLFFFLFLLFQIPLFFAIMFQFKVFNSQQLSQWRKPFFPFFVCFSACISPPDLLNQLLCTIFLLILFEFCIWMGYIFEIFHLNLKKTK